MHILLKLLEYSYLLALSSSIHTLASSTNTKKLTEFDITSSTLRYTYVAGSNKNYVSITVLVL